MTKIRIRIHLSEAWIRGSGPTPKCHGSGTLTKQCRKILPNTSSYLTDYYDEFLLQKWYMWISLGSIWPTVRLCCRSGVESRLPSPQPSTAHPLAVQGKQRTSTCNPRPSTSILLSALCAYLSSMQLFLSLSPV
jgi:hypothetical protein